jgi:hypothetical protein
MTDRLTPGKYRVSLLIEGQGGFKTAVKPAYIEAQFGLFMPAIRNPKDWFRRP